MNQWWHRHHDSAAFARFTGFRLYTSEVAMFSTILLVVLILALIGALPTWPHSRSWGYFPSGGLSLVVIILLVLVLSGRI